MAWGGAAVGRCWESVIADRVGVVVPKVVAQKCLAWSTSPPIASRAMVMDLVTAKTSRATGSKTGPALNVRAGGDHLAVPVGPA